MDTRYTYLIVASIGVGTEGLRGLMEARRRRVSRGAKGGISRVPVALYTNVQFKCHIYRVYTCLQKNAIDRRELFFLHQIHAIL